MASAVVLFGSLLESADSRAIVFDVEPRMGNAPEYGLAGQVTLPKRQCLAVVEAKVPNGYDLIRLPEQVAAALARQVGNVSAQRRKRP